MLEISYNMGGFGEANYINTEAQSADAAQERGHYFLQKRDDNDLDWIGGFGKNRAENASYIFLVQSENGVPDWNGSAYLWLDEDYIWLGTTDRRTVTFGAQNLEQMRLLAEGGLFLGDGTGVTDDQIGPSEIGMNRADRAPSGPGAGHAKLAFVNDPNNPGKAALVAYAGTSAVPTIVVDGIGDGF